MSQRKVVVDAGREHGIGAEYDDAQSRLQAIAELGASRHFGEASPEIRWQWSIAFEVLGELPGDVQRVGEAAAVAGDVPAEERERATGPRAVVEFAPSPEAVLKLLLPKYLEFALFSAMLETDAAFYAAQLVAMTNATENAGKLIDELTMQMNKARQAAITKELLEIVSGAEALVG